MDSIVQAGHEDNIKRIQTLGSVKLHHGDTKEVILIPTPSDDPNDPLNWSKPFKIYLMALTCFTLILANFVVVGPSVTIIETAVDLLHAVPPTPTVPETLAPASIVAFQLAIKKMAYVFSATALSQGLSNLFWMPLIVKYGRRPVYIISWLGYTVFAIWAGSAKSWTSLITARIFGGIAAGTAECMAPLTIADLTFLHQRGTMMALYAVALASGGGIGSVIDGALSTGTKWRAIYYLGAGLGGLVTILIVFTFPETAYNRIVDPISEAFAHERPQSLSHGTGDTKEGVHVEVRANSIPSKKSYTQKLKIWNGTLTQESVFTIFMRPVTMFLIPPVSWATTLLGVHIGFYVVLGNTLATSFSDTYNFSTLQIGLLWSAVVVGSVIGLPLAGWWTDWVADVLTRRNHGIREPEMRLPAMVLGMIVAPGSILLYGLSIGYRLHWIAPTIGLALYGVALAINTNAAMVYTIDAYRPVAGEVIVTQMGFKAAFAFLLGFYANPWLDSVGYPGTFGAQAGILFVVIGCWIPLYVYGKRIRHAAFKWKILKSVHWDMDRETGE